MTPMPTSAATVAIQVRRGERSPKNSQEKLAANNGAVATMSRVLATDVNVSATTKHTA